MLSGKGQNYADEESSAKSKKPRASYPFHSTAAGATVASGSGRVSSGSKPQPVTASPSFADRKKELAAEQSVKGAIVDGNGMPSKLQDDQLIYGGTPRQLNSVKKKVAAALSPEKVMLITNGDQSLLVAFQDAGEASSEVEKLLKELMTINVQLEAATASVEALHHKEANNPDALSAGIEIARGSGLVIAPTLTAALLQRAIAKAASSGDNAEVAAIIQWNGDDDKVPGRDEGITLSALVKTGDEAKTLQESILMKRVLDLFRCADTTSTSCVDDLLNASVVKQCPCLALTILAYPWLLT